MLTLIPGSHLDHDLKPEHLAWLLERFSDRDAFFIETVEIPPELPPLKCGLYGPTMGDEPVRDDDVEHDVRYVIRGERKCASRTVNRPARETRLLTVVAGPSAGEPCVLYTSYGGPQAPREPGDTSMRTGEEWLESKAFWADHALSA